MGILDSVRNARNASAVMAEHPAAQLVPDRKEAYIRALALTAFTDGSLSQNEKNYICMIANSLQYPADQLDLLLAASENPDQAVVSAVLDAIPEFACREPFLYDCIQVSLKDGEPHPDTAELLATFAELAGVSSVQVSDLKKLSSMLTGTDLFGARVFLEKKFGGVFSYVLKNLKVPLPSLANQSGPFASFGVQSGFETVVDANTGLFLIYESGRSPMEWGLAKMYIQKLSSQNTLSSASWRFPEIGELELLKDSKLLKDMFWSGTAGKDKDTWMYFDFTEGKQSSASPLRTFRVCAVREF